MWSWMHGGFGWGLGGLGMGLFWIVAIVALVVGFRFVVNSAGRRAGSLDRGDTPLDLLKRRYARGEIDLAEFEEKMQHLS